eukprot:gene1339-4517_t
MKQFEVIKHTSYTGNTGDTGILIGLNMSIKSSHEKYTHAPTTSLPIKQRTQSHLQPPVTTCCYLQQPLLFLLVFVLHALVLLFVLPITCRHITDYCVCVNNAVNEDAQVRRNRDIGLHPKLQ